MNEKVRMLLVLLLVVGILLMLIFTRDIFYIFEQTQLMTAPKDITSTTRVAPQWRFSTAREMLYILYGVRDKKPVDEERLLEYIRSHISEPSPELPYHLAHTQTDLSQCGQSAYVDKLLSGRRGGFFIECGAADGEKLSNSLFFELERNWTGILIEANPDFYQALLRKNRRAYALGACLSPERRPMRVRMQSADVFSRIVGKVNDAVGDKEASVAVNCFPLNMILAALKVSHVDYLSLDVEGPEIEILRTVDWTRLRIDVITIEYRVLTASSEKNQINKRETLAKLKRLRKFFHRTGIYREMAWLPHGSAAAGLDVVFSRIGNATTEALPSA